MSRVYCEYFSAEVFCYRLVKKAFLILPYSHHRNSAELGEYLRDLIRLHSKLNVPEILRYLLMPSHKILFRVLVALENQPYPIKAAGCQILFGNIEIEEPVGCPHPILHLEQQRPTVMGGFFCPLTNLFWNLTTTIAQMVALGYHITFGKHTVLDQIGPTQQPGIDLRVFADQFFPGCIESVTIFIRNTLLKSSQEG